MSISTDAEVTETVQATDPLRDLYADWSEIMATTPDLTMRLFRSMFDEWHQPTREPEAVTYKEDVVGGVPGIWAFPEGADRTKVLLYTHGGGFAVGSAASHRKLAGHVAKAVGVVTFVLDYRRAPEHPHPAQVEDGVAVFKALIESGIHPHDITTVGDSAGGNLAIAIPLALKEQGEPLPGQVIAFSPWLDMENKGETLVTNDATDALITPPLLEGMIAGVLGDFRQPAEPAGQPPIRRLHRVPPPVHHRGLGRIPDGQRHPPERTGRGSRRRRDPLHRRRPAARLPVPGRQLRSCRRRTRPHRRLVQVLSPGHQQQT